MFHTVYFQFKIQLQERTGVSAGENPERTRVQVELPVAVVHSQRLIGQFHFNPLFLPRSQMDPPEGKQLPLRTDHKTGTRLKIKLNNFSAIP